MSDFTESVVEQAALAWLEGARWRVRDGAEPLEPTAEREGYRQIGRATQRHEPLSPLATGDRRVEGSEDFVRRAV